MSPALQGLITIIIGVGGCVGYFYFSNLFLDKVLYPPKSLDQNSAKRGRTIALAILFALPALAVILLYGRPFPLQNIQQAGGFTRLAISLVVAALLFVAVNFLVPAGPRSAGDNINRANLIRPWLFLAPALIALSVYLAYPVVETLRLSLTQRVPGGGYVWVGLDNYRKMSGEPKFWEALRNNMLWLIVVPAMSTAFGLLAAQLSDRIRWGNIAKSLIFMPMAISFVGAAVIWKLVYDTRPADQEQIGILNAVWLAFEGGPASVLFLKIVPALGLLAFAAAVGWIAWVFVRPMLRPAGQPVGRGTLPLRVLGAAVALWLIYISLRSVLGVLGADLPYGVPQTWLTIPFWNSFFLMIVLVWIQTGFAMVILSAALRGVPEDTIEAAIVDGANPFQIFFKIKVPQIMGTIVVVWTTITIVVLKVFDIVFAMSNGQWETQVLANYMYDKLFRANDWGVGSASAMVIMLLVTPILIWNVYNARKEMR